MNDLDDVVVRMLCQGCGRSGMHRFGGNKPRWCRCPKAKRTHGPIVAAPGTVVRLTFESADDAGFRARAAEVIRAWFDARDALSSRWVRCGRGWRELPRSSPRRKALELAFRRATRAWDAIQGECPHRGRSLFDPNSCDVCGMELAPRRSA